MQGITTLQILLIALIGAVMVWAGWDSKDGTPILQFALIIGGAYIGGALTLALEKNEE